MVVIIDLAESEVIMMLFWGIVSRNSLDLQKYARALDDY
jgi:hypothetical protein